MITQPRLPCYELGIKFGLNDMPHRFLSSGRTGFYFAVVEEGELATGDAVERLQEDPNGISVADVISLYLDPENQDAPLIERALQIEALPSGWRKRFLKKLGKSKVQQIRKRTR